MNLSCFGIYLQIHKYVCSTPYTLPRLIIHKIKHNKYFKHIICSWNKHNPIIFQFLTLRRNHSPLIILVVCFFNNHRNQSQFHTWLKYYHFSLFFLYFLCNKSTLLLLLIWCFLIKSNVFFTKWNWWFKVNFLLKKMFKAQYLLTHSPSKELRNKNYSKILYEKLNILKM